MQYSTTVKLPGVSRLPADRHEPGLGADLRPGAKLFFVGEAFGEQEEYLNAPFVGPSGQEFTVMLRNAGIRRDECSISNVFNFRPFENKLAHLCLDKAEFLEATKRTPYPTNWSAPLKPASRGLHIDPDIAVPAIARLEKELLLCRPNLAVALGATAMWALCGLQEITKHRGYAIGSTLVSGLKVLPTFHPASIYRGAWQNRAIIVADLIKAKAEAEFKELRRLRRELWLEPSVADFADFCQIFLAKAELVSCDIETKNGQITCIGFAPTPTISICVPFWSLVSKDGSFYSEADELTIWRLIKDFLEGPVPKLFQNGLFDIQYLLRYGVKVRNFREDTMLLHHALYPELEKSLEFLGSTYANEMAWKQLRPRGLERQKKED